MLRLIAATALTVDNPAAKGHQNGTAAGLAASTTGQADVHENSVCSSHA